MSSFGFHSREDIALLLRMYAEQMMMIGFKNLSVSTSLDVLLLVSHSKLSHDSKRTASLGTERTDPARHPRHE